MGRGTIANFGKKAFKFIQLLQKNDLKIPHPILRNPDNFSSWCILFNPFMLKLDTKR